MMTVSSVSRKTTRKTGTEKTSLAIVEAQHYRELRDVGRMERQSTRKREERERRGDIDSYKGYGRTEQVGGVGSNKATENGEGRVSSRPNSTAGSLGSDSDQISLMGKFVKKFTFEVCEAPLPPLPPLASRDHGSNDPNEGKKKKKKSSYGWVLQGCLGLTLGFRARK